MPWSPFPVESLCQIDSRFHQDPSAIWHAKNHIIIWLLYFNISEYFKLKSAAVFLS